MSSSGITFSVPSTHNKLDHHNRIYTEYTVHTEYQANTFTAKRRFREFRHMHDRLKAIIPNMPLFFPLWPNVLNRLDPAVVAQRQIDLATYLTDVLAALRGSQMPDAMRFFLGLPLPQHQSQPSVTASPNTEPAMMQSIPIDANDTVILVAYQLPLKLARQEGAPGGGWSVEWDEESVLMNEALALTPRTLYVGCLGVTVEKEEEEELSDYLLEHFSCVAVFLPPQLVNDYYHGFCRSYLRPIFHNHLRLAGDENPFSEAQWRAYCAANKKFSEKVMEVYEPGYMVWVHDYHLLLLPSYILRRHRAAQMGLFLHSPFPASDVFRSIAVRESLLRAMLNADLIGFLLFEYTRNFLACCKRLLGLDHEFKRGGFLGVEYGGRHVMVQVSTFGVSPALLQRHMLPPLAPAAADELAPMRAALTKLGGRSGRQQGAHEAPLVMLSGVDHLDRFKGITLKLLAWEGLLESYPKYRTGHVLVQIIVSSRNQTKLVADANDVLSEIIAVVERINTRFPGVVYVEAKQNFSLAARLLLWLETRVLVYSAVREAVNAHPLEYLFARHLGGVRAGVAVLSEFSGFSRVLNGALTTNPFDQAQLQQALDQALQMSPSESDARGRKDLRTVESNTAEEWARRFLTDLKSMKRKQEDHWMAVGFGLASFRMIGMGTDFKSLDTQSTLIAYRQCTRRAILLDWGGTLAPADTGFYDEREEGSASAPPQVLEVLRTLCADPSNHVMIVSGLSRDKVELAFGSVPNLSLAVEHGFHFRIRSGPWQQLKPGVDTSWREVAGAIMQVYMQRTSGSFVQRKGSSITWNYASADPEYGAMQARELQYQLQSVLDAYPVVVRAGKGYVEACPKGINKGVIAERFVELSLSAGNSAMRAAAHRPPPRGAPPPNTDFVLCVGDDSSDEFMFTALHNKFGRVPADMELFTATVGRKPSGASSYLGDHHDVVELLKMLAATGSNKNKRYMSMNDITKLGYAEEDASSRTSGSDTSGGATPEASRRSAGVLPPASALSRSSASMAPANMAARSMRTDR